MAPDAPTWKVVAPAVIAASAIATGALIKALMPTLARYALARPNARSSHRVPTPQGGGMAIVAVVCAAMIACWLLLPAIASSTTLACLLGATLVLAVVGAIDDIVTLRALPRLLCQLAAAAVVIWIVPSSFRIIEIIPVAIERAVLIVALVWFINLTNFMDGLDWITIAELLPVCAGIAALSILGHIPAFAGVVACAICGATLGFAPFNRPIARLFLGDVGSLPLGLIVGWLLIIVAGAGHLGAAVLLPLYYLADATITLVRRLARGEQVWQAHRTHYYQRATDNGYTVIRVVREVFATNLLLLALAIISVVRPSVQMTVGTVAVGAALVAVLLGRMSRRP